MSITAVVTGAASGVGRECTRILLAKGYHIAAMDLRADAITAAFPDAKARIFPITVDIGDHAQCAAAVATAVKQLGGIDAFLHFAAIWVGTPGTNPSRRNGTASSLSTSKARSSSPRQSPATWSSVAAAPSS